MDTKAETKQVTSGIDDALLVVNKLKYQLPAEISVAKSKTHVVDLFQSQSFEPGETMILNAQTGSDFISARESWLEFTVKAQTAAGGDPAGDVSWGSGSAMNVFELVYIKARNGRELCRLENANVAMKIMTNWKCPQSWFSTAGSAQGYNRYDSSGGSDVLSETNLEATGAIGDRYAIPLHHLCPFFDQKKLLPPQLMEGLQIELRLETAAVAFRGNGTTTVGKYVISAPEIHWSTVTLADQFRRKINEISAKSGLYLLHKELFHQQTAVTTTQANYDVKKACSKALMSVVVDRSTATLVLKGDSMGSYTCDYSTAIAKIGSNYYPQKRLESSGTTTDVNFYINSLHAFGKTLNCWYPPSVSLDGYRNGSTDTTGATAAKTYGCCYATLLNKSGVTDMDGVQINNSRALVYDISFRNQVATRRLDTWLEHVRATQLFGNNAVVRD